MGSLCGGPQIPQFPQSRTGGPGLPSSHTRKLQVGGRRQLASLSMAPLSQAPPGKHLRCPPSSWGGFPAKPAWAPAPGCKRQASSGDLEPGSSQPFSGLNGPGGGAGHAQQNPRMAGARSPSGAPWPGLWEQLAAPVLENEARRAGSRRAPVVTGRQAQPHPLWDQPRTATGVPTAAAWGFHGSF